MTEFGLKLRSRGEPLVLLEDKLQIPSDIIRVLTNFQVDAIRFLWRQLKTRQSCIYNDGNHMGKRIAIGALIASLIKFQNDARILIGCDKDALPMWIFKLQIFMQLPRCKWLSGTTKCTEEPIVFVNTSDGQVDWKELVAGDNLFTMIVLDLPSTDHFKFGPYFRDSSNFVTVICSADVTRRGRPALFEGFFKCFNYSNGYNNVLRRTNEQHLREFPWVDQNRFESKYQQWKGQRSASEFILELNTTTSSPKASLESKRIMEHTQEMSALLFETDDDEEPEQEIRLPPVASVHSSLLGSMYLRISQSFTNNTPKQKNTVLAAVQDSPDLFASLLEESESDQDILNECNISTPKTAATSTLVGIPSQSPIREESSDTNPLAAEHTLTNNKTDVFDITVNEVFASKIKVTTSQNLQPIEVNDEDEQLKFDTPEILLRTPTSIKCVSTSPSTPSGWLSKRTVPNHTPEKVLIKKRRSLAQFYNSKAESRGSLDLSTPTEEALFCLNDEDL